MSSSEEEASKLHKSENPVIIQPPKDVECRKCGKIDMEPGIVMAMYNLFRDEDPPVAEMAIRCKKCGRTVIFDVKIVDENPLSSN